MQSHHRYLAPLLIGFASMLTLGCDKVTEVAGPSTGSIQITSSSIGQTIDQDPDGFLAKVDDGGAARVPATGVFVRNLSLGTHLVTLTGIAPNCSVKGPNPFVVELTANRSAMTAAFEVECQPNIGSLRISTVTTGEEIDENGYEIFAPQYHGQSIAPNGAITMPNLRAGVFDVHLEGIAPNCDHLGSPVRPTEIVFGKTTEVGFTLRCVASGRFQITTKTSGPDPDENGYDVEVSNRVKGTVWGVRLPANGTTELAGLPPGDYSLRLSDIVNNCFASQGSFSPVGLAAGSATSVAFDVACEATKQIAYTTATAFGFRIQVVRSNAAENFQLTSQAGSNFDPDWSRDGSRLAFTSDRDGSREIYSMDPGGLNVIRLTTAAGTNYRNYRPAWSPDGRKIAFVSERDANAEIYVMDADGTNPVRITNNPANDVAPSWSPDGSRIAFQSDRDGIQGIWIMNSDGSSPTRLPGSVNGDQQPSWSPDGTKIAFARTLAPTVRDIFMIDVDGSHLTQLSFNYSDAADPSWSPDGRQIAYSATFCNSEYYYYYYGTCDVDILLARTDGRVLPSTPVLAAGYNPAWRQ